MAKRKKKSLKVFIICRHMKEMKPAIDFLSRRGIQVAATTSLGEAVQFLVKNKPDYLLVSYDHPHKKITRLPKVFQASLGLTAIPFAEKSSPQVNARLNMAGADYVLLPPINGPSVHRLLQKAEADKAARKKNEDRISHWEDENEEGMVGEAGEAGGVDGDLAASILASLSDDPEVASSAAPAAQAKAPDAPSKPVAGKKKSKKKAGKKKSKKKVAGKASAGTPEPAPTQEEGGDLTEDVLAKAQAFLHTMDESAEPEKPKPKPKPTRSTYGRKKSFWDDIDDSVPEESAAEEYEEEEVSETASTHFEESDDGEALAPKKAGKKKTGKKKTKKKKTTKKAATTAKGAQASRAETYGDWDNVPEAEDPLPGRSESKGNLSYSNQDQEGGASQEESSLQYEKKTPQGESSLEYQKAQKPGSGGASSLDYSDGDDSDYSNAEEALQRDDALDEVGQNLKTALGETGGKNIFTTDIQTRPDAVNYEVDKQAKSEGDQTPGIAGKRKKGINYHNADKPTGSNSQPGYQKADEDSSNHVHSKNDPRTSQNHITGKAGENSEQESDLDKSVYGDEFTINHEEARVEPKKGVNTDFKELKSGTEDAVKMSSLGPDDESAITEKVTAPKNVTCISIDSNSFKGFLVAAIGDQEIDDAFVTLVQARLVQFLRDKGEEVRDDDYLELALEEVEFKDWAMESAEFLQKAVHNGKEVAMAFFPTQEAQPEIANSKDDNMVQIKLEDIKADTPVDFDMYLYLPRNSKYVRYTKKGNKILGNQKSRLKNKGVDNMHIMKEDVNKFKGHRAESFLNDQIDQFKKKSKKKAS